MGNAQNGYDILDPRIKHYMNVYQEEKPTPYIDTVTTEDGRVLTLHVQPDRRGMFVQVINQEQHAST